MIELPAYGLRAYALMYSRHGSGERFKQNELDWIVSEPMKKKIFALLLRAGWVRKASRNEYQCVSPHKAIKGLLESRITNVLRRAELPYTLTGQSAIEAWSDYCYVQRSTAHSPFFVKVLKKDLGKWKQYLNSESMPNYVEAGSTIGEFVVFKPVSSIGFVEKHGLKVEPLKIVLREARKNFLHSYELEYIKDKYGV